MLISLPHCEVSLPLCFLCLYQDWSILSTWFSSTKVRWYWTLYVFNKMINLKKKDSVFPIMCIICVHVSVCLCVCLLFQNCEMEVIDFLLTYSVLKNLFFCKETTLWIHNLYIWNYVLHLYLLFSRLSYSRLTDLSHFLEQVFYFW